jgi:hypothetical protein
MIEDEATGVLSGPVVAFAIAVGLPLARLQMAIPDELLDLCESSLDGDEASPSAITSTALVFALIQHMQVLPREENLTGLARTEEYLRSLNLTLDFKALVGLFVEMLANATLARRECWMDAARLWRMKLLLNPDGGVGNGGWDPSHGIAVALFAVDLPADAASHPSAEGAPVFWQRPLRSVRNHLRRNKHIRTGTAKQELRRTLSNHGVMAPQPAKNVALDSVAAHEQAFDELVAKVEPHAYSESAIMDCCPDYLLAAFSDGRDTRRAMRVWTTMLCLAVLETLSVCWASDGAEEATLVDDVSAWLERVQMRHQQGVGTGRSAALLRMGILPQELCGKVFAHAREEAKQRTLEWKLGHEYALAQLRTQAMAGEHGSRHGLTVWRRSRLLGDAIAALQKRHEFMSISVPMAEGLTRVHRAALFVTTLLCALTVDTWLYWSKASKCCGEMRDMLGCSEGGPLVPCRGFLGDCSDLREQFATLGHDNAHAHAGGDGPWQWTCQAPISISQWECTAFPNSNRAADGIYVGLIVSAVALPLRQVLMVLLQMSCEPEMEFKWLSVGPITFSFLTLTRLRRLGSSWRWRGARGVLPIFIVRYLQRYDLQPLKFVLEFICQLLARLLTRVYGHSAAARRAIIMTSAGEVKELEKQLHHVVASRVAGGLCVFPAN